MNQLAIYRRLSQLTLIVGPLPTLAISPLANFDPINLIKLMFVVPIGFSLMFIIASEFKNFQKNLSNIFWLFSFIFIFSLFSTLIFSGAPVNQQIWGAFGRNTGLVTYLSLISICISAALIQKTNFYESLINALLITAVPVTIYSLIQMSGNDPFGWSLKATFATLGNVNFLSAFLGLSSLAGFISVLEKKKNLVLRALILTMSVIAVPIILSTGSIQGFMILLAGLGIALFFYIRSKPSVRWFQIPYFILGIVGFFTTAIALVNKGPLAKFVFSETVTYRTDYMHAGWVMTLNHPFFGVGLDSYGDWYRQSRGLISTLRTGPERLANTAHNIFLDISSNGGLPLIFSYLAILAFAFRAGYKIFKRSKEFDVVFVTLFSCWAAYQIQSAISINQIGVGVWGWLLTGSLIGYEISTRRIEITKTSGRNSKHLRKKSKSVTLSAKTGVVLFSGLTVGFIIAFIPMNADIKFKDALQTNNLNEISKSTEILGSTAWHLNVVLDAALKNNAADTARALDIRLMTEYPKDYFGWRVRYGLLSSTQEERAAAINRARELDPFNTEIQKV